MRLEKDIKDALHVIRDLIEDTQELLDSGSVSEDVRATVEDEIKDYEGMRSFAEFVLGGENDIASLLNRARERHQKEVARFTGSGASGNQSKQGFTQMVEDTANTFWDRAH